jgi:L-rhamnose mutarotase
MAVVVRKTVLDTPIFSNLQTRSAGSTINYDDQTNYGTAGNGNTIYQTVKDYNILHDYPSYNYVITLAVLTAEQYNDPGFFSTPNAPLQHIILKSSGKGTKGTDLTTLFKTTENAETSKYIAQKENEARESLLKEFNEKGVGRFDLYVDNVEVITAWTPLSGAQVSSHFGLDIIEPYGMTGLMETLRVNALAAGHDSYQTAPFVIKIEFVGADDGFKYDNQSKVIPKSTRFFPVTFSEVFQKEDERGTVYQCKFNAGQSAGYGIDGRTPTNIKAAGNTLGDILDNFIASLNEAKKKENNDSEEKDFTEYKIEFMPFEDTANGVKISKNIRDYAINDFLKSNQIFVMPEQDEKNKKNAHALVKQPTKQKWDPKKETIQFAEGSLISEIILGVIRESDYTKTEIIQGIDKWKKDAKGQVPWFRVVITSEIKKEIDKKNQKPVNIFTYKVFPYWVHYSRLPLQGMDAWDPSELRQDVRRSYNYLYTGSNIDILEFNLTHRLLFFQQKPYALGEVDRATAPLAAAPDNAVEQKQSSTEIDATNRETGSVPIQQRATAIVKPQDGVSGKVQQATPYQQLALAIQNTLLDNNEQQDMEVKIIGDPFYLVTSFIGNQSYTTGADTATGLARNGESLMTTGEAYININFLNAKDYREDGYMDFGSALMPFSGVFMVRSVRNSFKDGQFTQRLTLTRLAGQVIAKGVQKVSAVITNPKPGSQSTKDTAPVSVAKSGIRQQVANLEGMLSKPVSFVPKLFDGLTGLATKAQNGINGALSYINNGVASSLKRVDAAIEEASAPVRYGLAIAGEITKVVATVGGVVAVADALFSGQQGYAGADKVGNNVSGYNPYSNGIRLTTTTIPAPSSTAQIQAGVAAQEKIISTFIQDNSNLTVLNQNYDNATYADGKNYSTNPSDPNNLNNIGQKVFSATQGSSTDLSALAAQLGLNPAEVTGLSPGQQSDLLSKLNALLSKVPSNTSIQGLQSLGVSIANFNSASFAKLPALQALTTAPGARVNAFDLQKIVASGGNIANLPGAAGVASVAALLALLGSKPNNGISNNLNSQSIIDKLTATADLANRAAAEGSNLSYAELGLGSVESNFANGKRVRDGYGGYYVETTTANALYGTQRQLSPLDKLMLSKST